MLKHIAASAGALALAASAALAAPAMADVALDGTTPGQAAAPPLPQYELIDMGTLGGTDSAAIDINKRGQVVGDSGTTLGPTHAFLWNPRGKNAGKMIDLGSLGAHSYAVDVNDQGQVVGWWETSAGEQRAFFWSEREGMTDLGTIGSAQYVIPTRINNDGEVVGNYQTNSVGGAFYWSKKTGLIDLPGLGGTLTRAHDINDDGEVVGDASPDGGGMRAVRWAVKRAKNTAKVTDLGALEGPTSSSSAARISDRGDVVGNSHIGSGIRQYYHAFSLDQRSATMTDLTPNLDTSEASSAVDVNRRGQVALTTVYPCKTCGHPTGVYMWDRRAGLTEVYRGNASAADINDQGTVIGNIRTGGNSRKRFQAFRWDAGTGVVPLGTPDSHADAINNRGEVVGQDRVDGQRHAVLWMPASN